MRTPAPVGTVAAVIACGIAIGCGGSGTSTSPGPQALAPAFVYVLTPPPAGHPRQAAVLSSLKVTETGDLQLVGRQPVIDARALAADPRGRVLFLSGGPAATPIGGHHYRDYPNYLRALAIDPATGSSTALSEQMLPQWPHDDPGYPPEHWQVIWLAAVEGTVYVDAEIDEGETLLSYGFDSTTGAMTPRAQGVRRCGVDGVRWLLPWKTEVMLPDTSFYCWDASGRSGHDLATSAFGIYAEDTASGGLVRIADTPWPAERTGSHSHHAAKVGDCLALAWYGYENQREVDGMDVYVVDPTTGAGSARGTIAAEVTGMASSPSGLLATVVNTTGGAMLNVDSVSPTCDVVPRFSLPTAPATSLAFHPSGRLLFVMQNGGIQTYALSQDGGFEQMRGFAEGLTGPMVLAAPSP